MDRVDAQHCDGVAGSVTARSSGRPTLVAMVQGEALPAQDGQLMSQGDEFELQGEATTNLEREQMGYWGSPVRRAGRLGGCASG